jgi:hypothetical protein
MFYDYLWLLLSSFDQSSKCCFWQLVPRRTTPSSSTHRPTDDRKPWVLDVYPSAICTSTRRSRGWHAGTPAEFAGARRVLHTPKNVSSRWPRWKRLRGTTSDEQTAANPIRVHFVPVSPLPYVNCTMSRFSVVYVMFICFNNKLVVVASFLGRLVETIMVVMFLQLHSCSF